tara:strand:- start:17279 stop:17899 length:621 start_codon:yes stop_codon:yes gene_type:complete
MIDLSSYLEIALDFFNTPLGVVIFICLYALWVICLLPGLWLSMFAGAVFGSFYGSIIVFIGAFLGAEITFLLGRKFLRNLTQRLIAKSPKFKTVEKAISKEGLRLVFLTRLSPAFPFSLLNLFYGLSEVSVRDFSIGMIAILPGTILYCSLGAFAGDIAKFDEVLANRNDLGSLVISFAGLIATFAVVWLISNAARKSIQEFDNSL